MLYNNAIIYFFMDDHQEQGIEQVPKPGFWGRFFREIWEFSKIVVVSLAIVLPIRLFIAQPFIVRGASMEPNFQNGEYLIIDEVTYRFSEPERGEIIVFRYPKDPSQFFIKRIIGLPGDTVTIAAGSVRISNAADPDGFDLQEAYLPDSLVTAPSSETVIGEDEYFVLGDNRPFSSDSRRWGVLEEDFFVGRAWLRLWPVTGFGVIEHQ